MHWRGCKYALIIEAGFYLTQEFRKVAGKGQITKNIKAG
jgi:hypothetical protein